MSRFKLKEITEKDLIAIAEEVIREGVCPKDTFWYVVFDTLIYESSENNGYKAMVVKDVHKALLAAKGL